MCAAARVQTASVRRSRWSTRSQTASGMDLVPAGGCGATGSAPYLDGATAIFGQRVSRFVSHREAPGFGGAVPGRVGLTQSCALVEPKLTCQVIRGEPGGGARPKTGMRIVLAQGLHDG